MEDKGKAGVVDHEEEELLMDTSQMSEEKRQTMEIAEAAREKEYKYPSFGSQLFMGTFAKEMVYPFPEQNAQDKAIGDEMVEKVRQLLLDKLDPEEVDATRVIPESVIKEMAEMGIFAMKVPQEYGGLGFSQVNYNRVMQAISSYCGSTAVLVSAHQSIGVPQPLKMYGTEEQKKKWLPRFRQGAISAFALTEPDVGSDPANMKTTATPTEDGEHYIINGDKLWCTNGPIADLLIVMCLTPSKMVKGREKKQISAFVVEGNAAGLETIHRCDFMGLRGIHNGLLRFKDVKVPKENLIWGEGRGLALALGTLNTGRLTLPAACSGLSKACLHIARVWGNERVQWGSPIGEHEEGSQKIANIASMTLAIDAVTWLSSHWADNPEIDIRIEAAMAKYFCTEQSWRLVDETLQLRGGRGYERASSLKARGELPFPVERMMRDCRINTIIEGTSEIMRLFLAREAMDPHLQRLAGLLKSSSTLGDKMKTAINMMGFYGSWYPQQWVNSSLWNTHGEMGPLAGHFQFIEKQAHKLARTLFHVMGRYQQKLELKQMILSRLIDIGTDLFAMACTCSYAKQLQRSEGYGEDPIQLADHFCLLAKRRIADNFKKLSKNDDAAGNQVAESVLKENMLWLEDGIISPSDYK